MILAIWYPWQPLLDGKLNQLKLISYEKSAFTKRVLTLMLTCARSTYAYPRMCGAIGYDSIDEPFKFSEQRPSTEWGDRGKVPKGSASKYFCFCLEW